MFIDLKMPEVLKIWTIASATMSERSILHIYINTLLSICLYVYMYPIDVKMAEPIGPKFWGIYMHYQNIKH